MASNSQQRTPRPSAKTKLPTPTIRTLPSALNVPTAFGIVEPGVYRSSAFHAEHFEFVKSLGLRSIVYLSPEVALKAVDNFVQENNIKMIHLGLKIWKPSSWMPMSEDLVKEAMEIVLDKEMHPLLLMCTSGVHQTGTLVGCLRKLQQWSFTGIIDEYRSVAGDVRTRYTNEHFVELFDLDLINLPKTLPLWFTAKEIMLEEEAAEFAEVGTRVHTSDSYEDDGEEGAVPAYKLHYYVHGSGPLKSKDA